MEKNDRPENIQKLIQIFRAGRWEEGEKLWKEVLQGDNIPIKFLREPAQELWRRSQKKLAKELVSETVTVCLPKSPLQRMEAIRLFAEYNTDTKYTDRYLQAFLEEYGERPYIHQMATSLNSQQYTLAKFIETLHNLLLFQEGTIIKHKSGWGVGKVITIYPETMEMIVQLKKRPNHRMDILGAAECLTPLPPENFEAMVEFKLDMLQDEAKNDETKLLHRIFNFHKDEISAREFKQYLCPSVIPEEEWTKWWAKARKMLLVDPYVEANSGAHSKYRLRQEPLGWEQEIRTKFDVSSPLEQPQIVLDYLKHTTMKQNLQYFAGTLIKLCRNYLQQNQPGQQQNIVCRNGLALECYFVVQECGISKITVEQAKNSGLLDSRTLQRAQDIILPELKEIVTKDNIINIYNNLRMAALAQQTLDLLLKYQPDCFKHIGSLFKKGTDLSRDTLYKYLHKTKTWSNHVNEIIKEIQNDPLGTPDGLIWLSRQVFNEKIPTIEGHEGAGLIGFFDTLLSLIRTGGTLKSLRQTEMVKKMNKIFSAELIKKIINMLDKVKKQDTEKKQPKKQVTENLETGNGKKSTTKASKSVEIATQETESAPSENKESADKIQAANLYTLLEQTAFLPSNFKQSLQNSLREKYPNLFSRVEHIYTTKEGLARYRAELEDVIQNQIPQNSKAIGEALSFGDISENAELDAAREIQFQLTKKVSEMQNNLNKIALIDFDNLSTESVDVGCIITLQDDTGKQIKYTILGPWDVDTEKKIISFMSAIAKKLYKKKVGDDVSLPAGDYKVISIEAYQSKNSED